MRFDVANEISIGYSTPQRLAARAETARRKLSWRRKRPTRRRHAATISSSPGGSCHDTRFGSSACRRRGALAAGRARSHCRRCCGKRKMRPTVFCRGPGPRHGRWAPGPRGSRQCRSARRASFSSRSNDVCSRTRHVSERQRLFELSPRWTISNCVPVGVATSAGIALLFWFGMTTFGVHSLPS